MRARVEKVFHEVADLSDEFRARYFQEHQIDTATRREVDALLTFDADSSVLLSREIGQVAERALARLEGSGLPCGPYVLGELLGRGGMGAVFLAERTDGEVAQRVAIKLLRPGADDPQFRQRFLAERQILASLSHANIARLLDAGHREDGQPYLVMEYVDGKAIDDYTADLGIRQKVTLFLKVCGAVAYLHRNLVVHRDLKPPNILVTGEGEPKLLDFGIAKLLDLTGDSSLTGVPMFTPDYASPEQAAGGPVSTATDIYSLGAVLYKLLTGMSPHRFAAEGAAPAIPQITIVPPGKLKAGVKGDLEVMLMKALRKEPRERYATIEQFSEDLENYLESRPIRARKGDAWYRTRKFLRRFWLPVGAGALAAAGLLGGAVVANRERVVAERRFVQVRQLAGRFIELHDDVLKLPGSTKVREKMVATALDYLDNLSSGAGNDAALLAEIGQAYEKVAEAQGGPGQANLGRTADALESFRKAVAFETRAAKLKPAYRFNLVSLHSRFAYVACLSGRLPEARRNLDEAAALLDRLVSETPDDSELLVLAAKVATSRADLLEFENKRSDELPFLRAASAMQYEYVRRKPSNAARLRAFRQTNLYAGALREDQRYGEALAELRAHAPVIEKLLADEPENPAFLREKMAAAQQEGDAYDNESDGLGKPKEAAAAFRRYLEIARKLAAADANNASARLSVAIACYKLSWPLTKIAPQEAISSAVTAVRVLDRDLALKPQDHLLRSRRARALRHLSYAYWQAGLPAEARKAIEEALSIQQALAEENPSDRSERWQADISRNVLNGYLKK